MDGCVCADCPKANICSALEWETCKQHTEFVASFSTNFPVTLPRNLFIGSYPLTVHITTAYELIFLRVRIISCVKFPVQSERGARLTAAYGIPNINDHFKPRHLYFGRSEGVGYRRVAI